MGIKQLREKYGKNLKGRKALNAAVRAELIGGDDVLDALNIVNAAARAMKDRDFDGWQELEQAAQLLIEVADKMRAEIGRRYDLKNTGGD